MKVVKLHLVLECPNHEEEVPLRAYTKKRLAKAYVDLRRRSETAARGPKGFRVVSVPLFVEASSPAGSVVLSTKPEDVPL